MRQVVLVVVLVGAAFLGGAFVNGPGLRWVQTQVLGSLGLDDGGEIATVDLRGGAGPEKERAGEKRNPGASVLAPVVTLPSPAAEPAAKPTSSERRPVGREAPGPAGPAPAADRVASASSPPLPDLTPPADSPSPSTTAAPVVGAARASRDPELTRASAAAPAADGRRGPRPSVLDSLAAPMPEPAPAPPEGLPTPAPTPGPGPSPSSPSPAAPALIPVPARAGDEDWAALARKMQALGVSRFTIEGQPGGRAVFSCLIPLAGRQAVAQRFEADGDDAVQAARAALRRVALWRAAQPQPASQPTR